MSVASLCDHTATVYRATEAVNGYREKVNTWAAAGSVRLRFGPARLASRDDGAGEHYEGALEAFAPLGSDIAKEDVLRVMAGPRATSNWRVESPVVVTAGQNPHHVEMTLVPFDGEL